MRNIYVCIIVYVMVLIHSAIRTVRHIFLNRYAMALHHGDLSRYYLVFIYHDKYFFITDISVTKRNRDVLSKLVDDARYRWFYDNNGKSIDNCFTIGVWHPSLFQCSHIKMALLDEVPLNPFSKTAVRELFHDALNDGTS